MEAISSIRPERRIVSDSRSARSGRLPGHGCLLQAGDPQLEACADEIGLCCPSRADSGDIGPPVEKVDQVRSSGRVHPHRRHQGSATRQGPSRHDGRGEAPPGRRRSPGAMSGRSMGTFRRLLDIHAGGVHGVRDHARSLDTLPSLIALRQPRLRRISPPGHPSGPLPALPALRVCRHPWPDRHCLYPSGCRAARLRRSVGGGRTGLPSG